MQVLDSIAVRGRPNSRVELWHGDVTDLEPTRAVDALLVSAFPDNYLETPSSLIGALAAHGLSVAELATHKDLDIRKTHSCWLSSDLTPASGLPYRRLICFEPDWHTEPPERVGDIFRALEWILAVRPEIRSLAMPVVAAGDMGYPIEAVLPRILDAALPWLELGLGLDRLAIVTRSDGSTAKARGLFGEAKARYTKPAAPVRDGSDFDVFVSYSHKNSDVADQFIDLLRARQPDVRVFLDRDHLQTGMAWQEEIYESLERSRYVVALLSPAYLESKACKEEFAIARLHGDRTRRRVLQPVYVLSADLPARIRIIQYLDAREAEREQLQRAAEAIVKLLST